MERGTACTYNANTDRHTVTGQQQLYLTLTLLCQCLPAAAVNLLNRVLQRDLRDRRLPFTCLVAGLARQRKT